MIKKLFFYTILFAQSNAYLQELPVDITFLAIDLKFNNGNVKILEFQDGPQAGLRAYDFVFGKGGVWRALWDELFSLNIPIWYVGKPPQKVTGPHFSHDDADHVAFDYFTNLGGLYASSLEKIAPQPLYQYQRNPLKQSHTFLAGPCNNIILYKPEVSSSRSLQNFAQRCPQSIIINRYMRNFSADKLKTHGLCCAAGASSIRPRCGIFQKKYHANLAAEIQKTIGGHLFVIKPINSSRSNGVLVVPAESLDAVLKNHVTSNTNHPTTKKSRYRPKNTETFSYWEKDVNNQFIVESFFSSQELMVNNKRYDPTMRGIWIMISNGKLISIKRLATFWKVATNSLDDLATPTEKLVSKFRDDFANLNPKDLTVSANDLEKLDAVMLPALTKIYTYALKHPTW